MRYRVCVFPAPLGDPWETDRYWLARLWFWWRSWGRREVRLIDAHTGEHLRVR